jgi:hypothetical protein
LGSDESAHHGAGADGGALVASVVKDPLCARLHLAQVLDGGGVGHAVPHGLLVAKKVIKGVNIGFGLEEEVVHIQWAVGRNQ